MRGTDVGQHRACGDGTLTLGDFLGGNFDEEAEAEAFSAAVEAWRVPAAPSRREDEPPSRPERKAGFLEGGYDEEAESAAFKAAVEQWRALP